MTMHEDRDRRLSRAEAGLDRLLAQGPEAPAPRGFADAVAARIADDARARVARGNTWLAAGLSQSLPVWVRMWAEPAVALATVLAALLAWVGPWLFERTLAFGRALQAGADGAAVSGLGDPQVGPWLAGALALVALVAMLPLYRATERWTLATGRRAR